MMDEFDEQLMKEIESFSDATVDYSDPDVVMGNIQAVEGALVKLLYSLTAINQLSKAEAEDCFNYSVVAALKEPALGGVHNRAYRLTLLRLTFMLRAMHKQFPLA